MRKLVLKPVSMLAGAAAGLVAGVLVKQAWRLATGQDDTPDSDDLDHGWWEVLAAAALQGAVFAAVKAMVDHATATAVDRLDPNSHR